MTLLSNTQWLLVLLMVLLVGTGPVAAQAPEVPYVNTRSLEIPFQPVEAGAAPILGYQLWYTVDGGQSWQKAPKLHEGQSPLPFQAPADGRFGFIIAAKDRAGNESSPPQPGSHPDVECIIDTTAPFLEVTKPQDGDRIYAGTPMVVEWKAHDENLLEKPVTVEYRTGPEMPWEVMGRESAHPAEGRYQWFPPLVEGHLDVRVLVRDRGSHITEWTLRQPLEVVPYDGFRGSRVMAAAPFSSFRKFPVHYRSSHFSPIELATVEIWARRDFGQWQRQEDPDRASPYLFTAYDNESATYDYYLRCLSRNGEEDRPAPGPDTPPDARVQVDFHPPDGKLVVADNSQTIFHKAGEEISMQWEISETNLPKECCRLEYSLDEGESWRPQTSALSAQGGKGSYRWRPPLIDADSLRLRLEVRDLADNRAYLVAPTQIRLINSGDDTEALAAQRHQRGLVLAQRGDRQSLLQALESLDVATRYAPSSAEVRHDRGVVLTQLGEHQRGLADFMAAHHLRPGDIPIAFSLIQCRLNLHRLDLGAPGEQLKAARRTFNAISRVDIYKDPNFRELLRIYKMLKKALKEE